MVNLSGLFDCYDVERYQYLKKKKKRKGGVPLKLSPRRTKIYNIICLALFEGGESLPSAMYHLFPPFFPLLF